PRAPGPGVALADGVSRAHAGPSMIRRIIRPEARRSQAVRACLSELTPKERWIDAGVIEPMSALPAIRQRLSGGSIEGMLWLAVVVLLASISAALAADPREVALGREIAEGAALPEAMTCSRCHGV